MRTIAQRLDREAAAPVVLAAALGACALGLELFGELLARSPAAEGAGFSFSLTPAAPRQAPAYSRLMKPVLERRAEPKGPMGLDEFVGRAKAAAPAGVAERVAKEFLGEPPLLEELTEFQRAMGGEGPASELLDRLRRRPEFGALVSAFRSDPGFQEAFAALARDPRAADVLRGVMSEPLAGRGRSRDSRFRGARSRALGLSSSAAGPRALATQRATAIAPAAQPAGAGRLGASAYRADASGSSAQGTVAKAAIPAIGPTRAASSPSAPSASGFASSLPVDGAACDAQSLWASAPKDLRRLLDRECELKGLCDPRQSCRSAGVLDRCVEVARSSRGCESQFASADAKPDSSPVPAIPTTPVIFSPSRGGQRLVVDAAPAPTLIPASGRSFWRGVVESAGSIIGKGVGFLVGLLRQSDWSGVRADAAAGAERGTAVAVAIAQGLATFVRWLL